METTSPERQRGAGEIAGLFCRSFHAGISPKNVNAPMPSFSVYERIPDAVVTLFQKEVKAGETIKLDQWRVLLY